MAQENLLHQLSSIFGEILCEIYHFNKTQVLFNLSWCAAHSIIAIFLWKFPQKVIVWHCVIGIWWDFTCFYNNVLQDLKKLKQMFPRLLLFYHYGVFNCLLHLLHSAKRKYKNENVKLFSNHGFYFVGCSYF